MLTWNDRGRRLLAVIAATPLLLLLGACSGQVTPEITAGVDGCGECGMVIDRIDQGCGWVHEGAFETFCSPACLLSRHDALRAASEEPPGEISFAEYGGDGFSAAENTVFLLTDHLPTVMNSGVITFASPQAAEATRRHEDEIITDWTGYRGRRGRPDVVVETVFRADGMEPESVTVAKGEIVLWRAVGDDLEEDLSFDVAGYPEIGSSTIGPTHGMTEIRFVASRPGAGFPVERLDDRAVLGMLKVTGAHTADEAAR